MNFVIASHHLWNEKSYFDLVEKNSQHRFYLITNKKELNYTFLKKINPKFIFFPHWSFIIPKKIINNFDCVCFHMTDLPYGRGGSPLQNLIIRNHTSTKISALKMTSKIDAGPIYLKRKLSLNGNAEEIYKRAFVAIFKMIDILISKEILPKPQSGKVTKFKRRLPAESEINKINSIEELYNFIRMLDAPNYPHAFFTNNGYIFELTDAKIDNEDLTAKVKINKIK
tara:strand:- start:6 stop:683 length:678 start_codon:yes stop_codon:yes gene_type:complete